MHTHASHILNYVDTVLPFINIVLINRERRELAREGGREGGRGLLIIRVDGLTRDRSS